MPRASDVERDLTHGEHVEVKYGPSFKFHPKSMQGAQLMMSSDRYAEAKTPANQPKKIVIPAVVSTYPTFGNNGSVQQGLTVQSSLFGWHVPSRSSCITVCQPIHPARIRTPTDRRMGKLTGAEFVFDDKNGLNFPFPVFLTTWHLTFSVRLSVSTSHSLPSYDQCTDGV